MSAPETILCGPSQFAAQLGATIVVPDLGELRNLMQWWGGDPARLIVVDKMGSVVQQRVLNWPRAPLLVAREHLPYIKW